MNENMYVNPDDNSGTMRPEDLTSLRKQLSSRSTRERMQLMLNLNLLNSMAVQSDTSLYGMVPSLADDFMRADLDAHRALHHIDPVFITHHDVQAPLHVQRTFNNLVGGHHNPIVIGGGSHSEHLLFNRGDDLSLVTQKEEPKKPATLLAKLLTRI